MVAAAPSGPGGPAAELLLHQSPMGMLRFNRGQSWLQTKEWLGQETGKEILNGSVHRLLRVQGSNPKSGNVKWAVNLVTGFGFECWPCHLVAVSFPSLGLSFLGCKLGALRLDEL